MHTYLRYPERFAVTPILHERVCMYVLRRVRVIDKVTALLTVRREQARIREAICMYCACKTLNYAQKLKSNFRTYTFMTFP